MAVEMEIIQKSGAFYRYGERMLGQGKAATIETLKEDKALAKEVVAKIMAQNKDGRPAPIMVGGDKDADSDTKATTS